MPANPTPDPPAGVERVQIKRRKASAKVAVYRNRLRAMGLRPIQIWVPDTRSPGFAEEARRQARLIAASPHDAEDQAFIDSISTVWDNE